MPPSAPQIKKDFFICSAATLQLAQRMRNVCIGSNRRLGIRDAVRASGVLPLVIQRLCLRWRVSRRDKSEQALVV
jgi:hypothetical protein